LVCDDRAGFALLIKAYLFMNRIIIFLLFLVAVIACDSETKNPDYLPKATGKPGDLILIMDSAQWKGPLGKEVRRIFEAAVPGLPQDEPMFKVVWVHPSKGITLLTQIRNLVYVFTLDQQTKGSRVLQRDFSPETLNKIKSDTSFYLSTRKDEYSKGQEVMYLFGATEESLIKHLRANKENIIEHFNTAERKRLEADLFKVKSTAGVAAFLRKEQQCELRVPVGYRLADKQDDFVWLRFMNSAIDKDVFITWKPYTSEYQMLPDSIIAWREAVARRYLFEDPENPISYLVTEQEDAVVHARQVSLNKRFAMEVRGLWRTNTRTMGGPFVGYSLIDEPRGLLYYIEGFAYAPGMDKREMIRELETILRTFKTSADIKKE
jgi:hypothetical protein